MYHRPAVSSISVDDQTNDQFLSTDYETTDPFHQDPLVHSFSSGTLKPGTGDTPAGHQRRPMNRSLGL